MTFGVLFSAEGANLGVQIAEMAAEGRGLLGDAPPAGSPPGAGGRVGASDTGAQDSCPTGVSATTSHSGISPGSGVGTNEMVKDAQNCHRDPNPGMGDDPNAQAGGSCCPCVMPAGTPSDLGGGLGIA
jgi:hypothetical protein